MKRVIFLVVTLFFLSLIGEHYDLSGQQIPVTGAGGFKDTNQSGVLSITELAQFKKSLVNNSSLQIVGLYAQNIFAFPVTQQPAGQSGFVSTSNNVVTQFSTAAQYNTVGMIAHNTLAGKQFFQIVKGQTLTLVYGDGRVENYRVSEIRQYRAHSPTSPYSSFIDLNNSGRMLTYKELFNETYGIGNNLILQTCISHDNVDSWGRLFIVAEKIQTSAKIQYHNKSLIS
jgi:hypothetical protein